MLSVKSMISNVAASLATNAYSDNVDYVKSKMHFRVRPFGLWSFAPGGACKPALPRQLMLIWAFTTYPGCHGQRWSQSTACHFAATACCASRSDRIHVITCR
jgi:hypothetical protein